MEILDIFKYCYGVLKTIICPVKNMNSVSKQAKAYRGIRKLFSTAIFFLVSIYPKSYI
ncbi:hypothetical protein ELOC111193_13360 [Elizabethkingia occulta]